jgi:hypothetical protein
VPKVVRRISVERPLQRPLVDSAPRGSCPQATPDMAPVAEARADSTRESSESNEPSISTPDTALGGVAIGPG